MMRRLVAITFASALACPGGESRHESAGVHEHGHQGDHEHDHEHDDAHAEVPRVVEISEQALTSAGVETTKVERRVIAPTVRLTGEIAADIDRSASVAARVEGIVERLAVRPGDAVAEGDVIATIRTPSLQALRAAQAALTAKAASARANADRLQGLVEKRMASHQEVLAAKAEASALEAEARSARERLRALGPTKRSGPITFDVRAPIAGVVTARPALAGDPVDEDTVLATVVATDTVWFVARVFERDVARVQEGAAAAVRLNAHPDQVFRGKVEYLSHQVDPGARTLTARIPLENTGAILRIGLFGQAEVTAGVGTETVLAVPKVAVTDLVDEQTVVFVRQPDGHFEVHEVVTGAADTEFVEIVRGLNEGESVVTSGTFTVKSVFLRGTMGEDHH